MTSVSKKELEFQIRTHSPNVSIAKCTNIRPEISGIEYKGIPLQNYVYCKVCHKVLSKCKGTTGNIFRHCKSHVQGGSGTSGQIQAGNYYYPATKLSKPTISVSTDSSEQQESDNYYYPVNNLSKPFRADISEEMVKSKLYELPKHITSETLKYLKESNMLPPQPTLAIRNVIKIEIQEGIPMAHVEWNDPSMYSTWIPATNSLHYYIYDTEIKYEDDDDESAESQIGSGSHKSRKSLSILQKRAIKRMHMQHRHH